MIPNVFEMPLEAEIGHDGRDHRGLRQAAVLLPALGDDREQLVAVDEVAALVGDHHAIGVAVERDPDVGAHLPHLAAERIRLGGAAILVDVEAVGIDADREHLGAEFPQRVGHDAIGRAVGAIDDDAQAVERDVARQGPLGEFDVAVVHAVDALGAPERGGLGELLAEIAVDQLLDLGFDLVGQLVAVRAEQLDAVVGIEVVRGRDHDAEVGAHRARQHGDRRRRHRAEQQHVHPDRGEAGDHGGFDHVAGEPRILADHHPVAVVAAAKHHARRLADPQCEVGRDHAIGAATDAIGAKILSSSWTPSPHPTAIAGRVLNRETNLSLSDGGSVKKDGYAIAAGRRRSKRSGRRGNMH